MSDQPHELVCPACGGRGPEAYCPNDGQRRVPAEALATRDPLIGRVIADRYAIERRLGQGGMGAVYLATQSLVERKVVVKVMRPEAAQSDAVRARFLREARAASRITHPHVITIHDFGYTDDGLAYLVMEYVDGPSLEDVLAAQGRLPWQRATRIAAQVARALDAAHGAGIVHRDIKPANIMLARADVGGQELAKVLDFGVARVQTADTRLTRTGSVMGTPAYMAPEQAAGREVGPAADLYALGTMIYDLVTGDVPFSSADVHEMMMKHLTATPPLMREAAGADLDVPDALEGLVAACLAKRAEDRPATAGALAERLEQLLADDATGGVSVARSPIVDNEAAIETVLPELSAALVTGMPALAAAEAPATQPVIEEALAASTPTRARRRPILWIAAFWLAVGLAAVLVLALRSADGDEPRGDTNAPGDDAVQGSVAIVGDAPSAPETIDEVDARGAKTIDSVDIQAGVTPAPLPPPRGLRLDHLPLE